MPASKNSPSIRNILLDRDGTIIQDMHYLKDPDKISFIPGAVQAMQEMGRHNLDIFLVTNQSGIGRKLFTKDEYHLVQDRLLYMLGKAGVEIKDSLFCPHTPESGCLCRKPGPGMWDQLSEKYSLRPEHSIVIGDKKSDVLLGLSCGFRASILVLTGHGPGEQKDLGISTGPGAWFEPAGSTGAPSVVAKDLYSAWTWIRQRFFHDR